jgi:hypothetical protein
MSEAIPLAANVTAAASLRRRLLFARQSFFVWDSLFCRAPLAPLSHFRDWQTPRFPDHAARIVYDAIEYLRTGGGIVPEPGNVEQAPLDGTRWPQHPRYLGYWHDRTAHSMVGMFIGLDIIRNGGRYYVIECNQGPSIYARRRALYSDRFDPFITNLLERAVSLGFEQVVPIALRWSREYIDEWQRAGRAYGIAVDPTNCPLWRPEGARHIVALPRPLAPRTMYVVHSGLNATPVTYVDNKWRLSGWMPGAIAGELPADTRVALPATSERLFIPSGKSDRRWPNLVVKLAGSARSRHVLAARFDDEEEAIRALGLSHAGAVPRALRGGYLKNVLLYGGDRVLYQEFIPPELDERGHSRMIRLHLFVAPLATMVLSAHSRISRRPVPLSAPGGMVGEDNAFVFNDSDYERLEPEIESELQHTGTELAGLIQREVARRFETSPDPIST